MPLTVVVALTWAEKMLALSTLASAVVLGLTVIAVFAQLNESQKTRLAALVSDLSRRWDEEAFRAARIKMTNATPNEIRQLVERAYHDPAERNKEFYDLQALANFLETLGVLEALSGGLTIELIDGLYGSSILNTWISWEPTVQFLRSRPPHPGTAYQNFQALYLKIKDRRDHVPA
jgi:ABC-type transport system involved in cytochrome bd biosynthesis fused ATPase/permease subunit